MEQRLARREPACVWKACTPGEGACAKCKVRGCWASSGTSRKGSRTGAEGWGESTTARGTEEAGPDHRGRVGPSQDFAITLNEGGSPENL